MILHTLNASPASSAFHDCIQVATGGDAVILLGDGVYAALQGTTGCTVLTATGAEIFLLYPDAQLAGIVNPAAGITAIDIVGFVMLTERFARQMAWY